MAASFSFFGSKGGTESINLAEGHGCGLDVELAGLGEIGFLVVDVIHFEQRGGTFASGGSEHRRIGKDVALRVHEIARGANGFGANTKNGRLAGSTDPEMAVIEKEIHAMIF